MGAVQCSHASPAPCCRGWVEDEIKYEDENADEKIDEIVDGQIQQKQCTDQWVEVGPTRLHLAEKQQRHGNYDLEVGPTRLDLTQQSPGSVVAKDPLPLPVDVKPLDTGTQPYELSMSALEAAALHELRSLLGDLEDRLKRILMPGETPDSCLLRFLRDQKMNAADAARAIRTDLTWCEEVHPADLAGKKPEHTREYCLPHQAEFEVFYNSWKVQVGVAALIGANFLTNIVEKEIDPGGEKHAKVFEGFELAYNILFTVELGVNMYAHWFWPFWISGWNIFDVIVVTIGIINTLQFDLPPAFSLLRMMRAFRVFRLFKRVHSLNKILVTIVHAIPGVANAFLILAIVMSIYAILAVEMYHGIGANCMATNSTEAWMETSRGLCVGEEYFGNFARSLYTFFQVLTGDSWSEAVARPAIWAFYNEPLLAVGGGAFFVFYVFIASFVLGNVVVAVLLDKMVDPQLADATKPRDVNDRPAQCDTEKFQSVVPEPEKSKTVEDLDKIMASVEAQVAKLMGISEVVNSLNSEITTLRSEMSTRRDHFTMLGYAAGNTAQKPALA